MEESVRRARLCWLRTLHYVVSRRDRHNCRSCRSARGGKKMTTLIQTAPHHAGYNDKLITPDWAEIVKITPEADGVTTFWFKFTDPQVQARYHFAPGQFNMLYLPGYGEAAISMSSDPDAPDRLLGHTIRLVGNVTKGIGRL